MKTKTVFICQACGYESQKWMGKCPSCENWNTLTEEISAPKAQGTVSRASTPVLVGNINSDTEERVKTGIGELDLVLGGGIVPGSLVLVGGEPGIGKSTLLLQICNTLSVHGNVLYASGEESERQLKLRADRLGVNKENLYVLNETDIDSAIATINDLNPKNVIIDSVQTMYTSDITSASGSVSQVREITMRLMRLAKASGITIFLVGHVTKDGSLAGPRVLEHMVDCVLYFEGDRHHTYRMLRAVKNRFGSTNEVGIFEMCNDGLREVHNPSRVLISERPENAPGSAVLCSIEGTRPMLAEVQALVSHTGFGIPRRMSSGIDLSRINLLIAVLEKRAGFNLSSEDVYINIIGGIKIDETAADLSIAAAIVSSFKASPIPSDMVLLGEIGLTGELRSISQAQKRVSESAKLGFKKIVLPTENAKALKLTDKDIKILPASTLKEAISYL